MLKTRTQQYRALKGIRNEYLTNSGSNKEIEYYSEYDHNGENGYDDDMNFKHSKTNLSNGSNKKQKENRLEK